jgi:hypothetical protein
MEGGGAQRRSVSHLREPGRRRDFNLGRHREGLL